MGILFIGNSYTYYNALPEMFSALAASLGREVHAESSTGPGYRLSRHANPLDPVGARTHELLKAPWDAVVLQEQSLGAATEKGLEGMQAALGVLGGMVRSNGGRPILYMTWGRRWGRPEEGFADFAHMQAALTAGYDRMGAMHGMEVAPVGLAWARARAMDDGMTADGTGLWTDDDSHPTVLGSLLAAYVLYGTVFKENPVSGGYTAGLDARSVGTVAKAAVETLVERGILMDAGSNRG